MRVIAIGIFLFISIIGYSQETETYQSDSILRVNNVKSRKWYLGLNKKLSIITYYDTMGRLVKLEHTSGIDGSSICTYYSYNKDGRLVGLIDTIKYGSPDMEAIKKLKSMGINVPVTKRPKGSPDFEVVTYKLKYNNESLSKQTTYLSDGSIIGVLLYKENKQITYWYNEKGLYRQDTAEYGTNLYHKIKYYGCNFERESGCWNYFFKNEYDSNGNLTKYIRSENNIVTEERVYTYDNKGLLIKTESKFYPEFFEYEYYK